MYEWLKLPGLFYRREFEDVRRQGHASTPPLRAVLRALRAARRRLASVPAGSGLLVKLDALVQDVERTLATTRGVARLVGLPRLRAVRG